MEDPQEMAEVQIDELRKENDRLRNTIFHCGRLINEIMQKNTKLTEEKAEQNQKIELLESENNRLSEQNTQFKDGYFQQLQRKGRMCSRDCVWCVMVWICQHKLGELSVGICGHQLVKIMTRLEAKNIKARQLKCERSMEIFLNRGIVKIILDDGVRYSDDDADDDGNDDYDVDDGFWDDYDDYHSGLEDDDNDDYHRSFVNDDNEGYHGSFGDDDKDDADDFCGDSEGDFCDDGFCDDDHYEDDDDYGGDDVGDSGDDVGEYDDDISDDDDGDVDDYEDDNDDDDEDDDYQKKVKIKKVWNTLMTRPKHSIGKDKRLFLLGTKNARADGGGHCSVVESATKDRKVIISDPQREQSKRMSQKAFRKYVIGNESLTLYTVKLKKLERIMRKFKDRNILHLTNEFG